MKTTSHETRKKSYFLFTVGMVLTILSLFFVLYEYKAGYQESLAIASRLSEAKNALKEASEGSSAADTAALQDTIKTLSDSKLRAERPYSYGLTILFFSVMLLLKGLHKAFIGSVPAEQTDVKRLALAGLMAALCYIGFAVFKIDIPVGTEKTAFHLGNVFCVLAALLLGGFWGGLAGAVGMTIGDLTTAYVTSAPKTFLLKLLIGLIVGLVAHRIFHLSRSHHAKYVTGVTIFSCICGMGFNVIADPLVGYFYKMYLLGIPQEIASVWAKWGAVTTLVNAIIAVICSSIFYLALRPALKKSGLFIQVASEAERGNE